MAPESADPSRMPILARSSASFAKASWAIKSAIVNPIPARNPTPHRCTQPIPLGSWAIPSRTASHEHPDPPIGLPAKQPQHNAPDHAAHPTEWRRRPQRDACIRQRENRHNQKRHRVVQLMFQPLQGRLHAQRGTLNRFHRRLLLGIQNNLRFCVGLFKASQILAHSVHSAQGQCATHAGIAHRCQHPPPSTATSTEHREPHHQPIRK